ncbi:hypothetical protein FQK07_04775 [Synechococcus sp. BSF8S]|uniref:hypothetical protein n=1 Tax=Synechococcales TaxID=1890424 RepID=UPI00162AE54B|nr:MULTISPECIES: hypothetical protein [unclassified Synechococcus]MBC1260588.1 hypothetical protein [Synechococcus sp. BSF8S]MBC1263239.1 hypothetical protein [Synechococcus sp. BSA11S]
MTVPLLVVSMAIGQALGYFPGGRQDLWTTILLLSSFQVWAPALKHMHLIKSLLAVLLGSNIWMLPAEAAVLVDLDQDLVRWSNDGKPAVQVRLQGEIRLVAEAAPYAFPIGPDRSLRFIPCLPPAGASPPGCEIPSAPAGAAGLVVSAPLVESMRMVYQQAWRRGVTPNSPEEDLLAIAMIQTATRLRDKGEQKLNLRQTSTAFQNVLAALSKAKQAGSAAPITRRAERVARMFAVFRDLWQEKNTSASRDLSMPCTLLEAKAEAFNTAAGADLVQVERRSPRGICFFCRNICTLESADALLHSMKQAVADELREATQSPVQSGAGAPG